MAPPKRPIDQLSDNPYTVRERKRREQPGFDGRKIAAQRNLAEQIRYHTDKLKATPEFKGLSPQEQETALQKVRVQRADKL
jgi:hypothetical protein